MLLPHAPKVAHAVRSMEGVEGRHHSPRRPTSTLRLAGVPPVTRPDRIPAILDRVVLADVVSTFAGPPVRSSGGTSTFRCPNPDHPDHHPSFSVKDGHWKCWSQCGVDGDAIDLLVWLDKVSKAEAIERLAARIDLQPVPVTGMPSTSTSWKATKDLRHMPSTGDDLLRQFLEKRCWDHQLATAMGLHLVTGADGQRWVRFPWPPGDGGETWHQDRRIGEGHPTWLSPTGRIPWPYRADLLASAREAGALVVCEGVSDVVAMIHAFPDVNVIGIPGAAAFKAEWATALAGLQLAVITDNDPAGQSLRGILNKLNDNNGIVVHNLYVPPVYNDIDEWRRADADAFPHAFNDLIDAWEASLVVSIE